MEIGTRVVHGASRRAGTFLRYETKFRTRWAVVIWDGRLYTDREYPHAIREEVIVNEPAKTTRPGNPPKPPER